MKTVLFCTEPYSFLILKPLADELKERGEDYIWYVSPHLFEQFPYKQMMHTNSLKYIDEFKSDAIFVPTNDVPYWLRGVKVHLFNSLIVNEDEYQEMINYFDLFLTPGPKFTKIFEELKEKHQGFDVMETGWVKLDTLFNTANDDFITWEKNRLTHEYEIKHIVLYAPSSDKELTSAPQLKDIILKLIKSRNDILFMVLFDEDMDKEIVQEYKEIEAKNVVILDDDNVSKNMHIADVLITDTSSLAYEFTLLDKPVLSIDAKLDDITWSNLSAGGIYLTLIRTLENSSSIRNRRDKTFNEYHPYKDGKSSQRVIEATKEYIDKNGVPEEKKVSFFKKLKLKKKFKNN
jgi:spore coat polysaccharide biosynthesis predicted glycosyltransferase SpsG